MTNPALAQNISAVKTTGSRWALSSRAVLQTVLLAGIFVLNFFSETDPDLWWHIATGRYIFEARALPITDPFSYTAVGRPWIIPEWLGEVTIYLLYTWGGYVGALSVFALVVTFTFWLILRSARHLGMGVVGATAVTTWAAAISWPFWLVRPHIVSFFFFALFLYLLVRSRRHAGRWIWLLPPVMVIWVNFHSAYVMGLALLGLFVLGEALARALGAISECGARVAPVSILRAVWPVVRGYLPVSAATVAAAMVNPEGPGMLLYPLTYTGNRDFNLKYVAEWRSPNFHEPYLLIFAASLLLLMVLGSRRPLDWGLTLPMIAVALMSLQWTRAIAFYAVILGPYLASRLASRQTVNAATESHSPVRPGQSRLNWVLLLACLGAMASPLFISSRAQIGHEPRLTGFPVEGLSYIRQEQLSGRLFNTYHWGGFVLWRLYPERSVFIDGRTDMYGAEIFADYREVYNVGPRWREVLDRYEVDVFLIEKDSALNTLLLASGEWEERFRGEIETVLVRRASRIGP